MRNLDFQARLHFISGFSLILTLKQLSQFYYTEYLTITASAEGLEGIKMKKTVIYFTKIEIIIKIY